MWGLACNGPLNFPVATVDARAGHPQHEGTIFKGIPFVLWSLWIYIYLLQYNRHCKFLMYYCLVLTKSIYFDISSDANRFS